MKCEYCINYEYDEESGFCECCIGMDQDEYETYLHSRYYSCPYFHYDNEYEVVNKQI